MNAPLDPDGTGPSGTDAGHTDPGHTHPGAEWRSLYRRLRPEPPADDVREADPETARVVGWMRQAYGELRPPTRETPRATPRPQSLPHVRRRTWLVAAGVLLSVSAALYWRSREWRSRVGRKEREQPPHLTQREVPTSIRVEFLLVRPDHVELRSGPVRLVLLDSSSDSQHDLPGS